MDKGAFDGLPFVGFNDDDVGERERDRAPDLNI